MISAKHKGKGKGERGKIRRESMAQRSMPRSIERNPDWTKYEQQKNQKDEKNQKNHAIGKKTSQRVEEDRSKTR